MMQGTPGGWATPFEVIEIAHVAFPAAGDEDDWREWRGKGDPIMHIELRKWADVLIIAPMSANSLAKASQGLCDNLLTCILRAWDFSKPCLVSLFC